jgi:hypothetical protein
MKKGLALFFFAGVFFWGTLGPSPLWAQTATPTVVDSAIYNFEAGTLQNFQAVTQTCCPTVVVSAAVTTPMAHAGTHSAAISIQNWPNGYSFLFDNIPDSPNITNIYNAWIYTSNPNIQCQLYVVDGGSIWHYPAFGNTAGGSWINSGWDTGAGFGLASHFGIKFFNNTGATYSGTLYVDSLTWAPATATFTPTPSFTPTATPTNTPSSTPTPSPTFTFTPTTTPSSTPTPFPTVTFTPTFTVTPSPSPTPPDPGNKPYVFANPSSGPTVHFVYTMAENGQAFITLLNDGGDVVGSVNEVKSSGVQMTDLDIRSFAPGHYFYLITLKYDSGRVEKLPPQILAVKR